MVLYVNVSVSGDCHNIFVHIYIYDMYYQDIKICITVLYVQKQSLAVSIVIR